MFRTAMKSVVLLFFSVLLVAGFAPSAAADIPLHQRRYVVVAKTIKAFDESGPFNTGTSDEIYGGFQTTHAFGLVTEVQSRLFGNFDAGNTRSYPVDQSCLSMPVTNRNTGRSFLSGLDGDSWFCYQQGMAAPFRIHGVLYERDTYIFIPPCGDGIPCTFEPRGPGALVQEGDDDDHLGSPTLNFSSEGLAADLPYLGSLKSYPMNFTGGGANYRVTIEVRRVV